MGHGLPYLVQLKLQFVAICSKSMALFAYQACPQVSVSSTHLLNKAGIIEFTDLDPAANKNCADT